MNMKVLINMLEQLPNDALVMMEEELGCGDTNCGFSNTYPQFPVGEVTRPGRCLKFVEAVGNTPQLTARGLCLALLMVDIRDEEYTDKYLLDEVIGVAFDNDRAILTIRKD